MVTSPSRSTAQNSRESRLTWSDRSYRGFPAIKSPSWMRKPMSSTRPRQKVSMLAAEGNRSSREISMAVAFSGLMIMSMPRSFFRSLSPMLYSGLRMRAMVNLAPMCLAVRQHTMFTSSELVAATSRSASAAPASARVAADTPLPRMLIMSRASEARRRLSSRISTMVTSYFSFTSCSAREKPTFPLPTMTTFRDCFSFSFSFMALPAPQGRPSLCMLM